MYSSRCYRRFSSSTAQGHRQYKTPAGPRAPHRSSQPFPGQLPAGSCSSPPLLWKVDGPILAQSAASAKPRDIRSARPLGARSSRSRIASSLEGGLAKAPASRYLELEYLERRLNARYAAAEHGKPVDLRSGEIEPAVRPDRGLVRKADAGVGDEGFDPAVLAHFQDRVLGERA